MRRDWKEEKNKIVKQSQFPVQFLFKTGYIQFVKSSITNLINSDRTCQFSKVIQVTYIMSYEKEKYKTSYIHVPRIKFWRSFEYFISIYLIKYTSNHRIIYYILI